MHHRCHHRDESHTLAWFLLATFPDREVGGGAQSREAGMVEHGHQAVCDVRAVQLAVVCKISTPHVSGTQSRSQSLARYPLVIAVAYCVGNMAIENLA
jgi:hypothetical protein